jgi:hypothetical protein
MSSTSEAHSRWWEGGNLHDKTIEEWLAASEQNRLATAVDVLFALKDELGAQIDYQNGEELMRHVLAFTACITGATAEHPDTYPLKLADVALASAKALGYLANETSSSVPL